MILRVLVASLLLLSVTSATEQPSFLSAVRSLIYGEQTNNHTTRSINQQLGDGTPGMLPPSDQSAYPDPPMTFNSFPAFTVGVTATTGSPCNLPQQIGTGPYRIPRWYFNPARMRCELFYWSGCCGNGNNFNTFQACQQVCEGNSNTAPPSSNFLNVQPSVQQPADWLRHRGTAISVTVEQVPMPAGMNNNNGRSACCNNNAQPRWYYERRSGMCQVYLYHGFSQSPSGNTFPSLEACQKACTSTDSNNNFGPAPHIVLPAVETTHLGTGVSGDGFRFGQNAGVAIGIGLTTTSSPITQVQPLPETMPPRQAPLFPVVVTTSARPATRSPQIAVDPCGQEREQGVGSLQLPRYFFNSESKLCEQFTYFGSGGNRNNFHTLEECQQQCPESPNPCAYGTVSSSPIQCAPGSVLSQTCSGQQFCHVGATPATTICCNKPVSSGDRCSQPLNIGIGNDNLQRWYFNPLTQQCQPCVYKGLQGNENNFISKQDCENSCQINPCQRGLPYRSQGVTVQCSATNQAICPAGYYCHVGADALTSLCCQALVSNPCNEVLAKGEGTSALIRFYYDAEKRQCLPFNYLGTKGNTNNFMSKAACEELCPVWVNPCHKGEPFLAATGKPTQCGMRQTCPTGFYCHIGYDDETTVCCQSHQNPCTALMSSGNGPHAMTRWFYDPSLRQCKQFMYKGLGGNENNFLLREHCEEACPVWQNPCPFGDPVLGSSNRPTPCTPGASNTCPESHWCHAGADAAQTVCCPGKQDPCVLAVAEGVGNSVLPRFYFDLTIKQCKEFTYRGTRGNANNFNSREVCELQCPVFIDPCPNVYAFSPSVSTPQQYVRCSADTQQCPQNFWCHIGQSPDTTVCCPNAADPCTLPSKIPGEGTLKLTRWSYDSANRQCEPFDYAGIKGNQNNFLSREVCETSCPVYDNPCRSGEPYLVSGRPHLCRRDAPCPVNYYCHIGTDEVKYCCPAVGGDPCGQPMDCGRGNANLLRWYWDKSCQKCVQFNYRGQKGTQNNFLTQQDCERTCFELDNPCALGQPQMVSQTEPQFCTIQNPNTCGASFWCHYGVAAQTTLCCPGRVEPQAVCQQPLVEGQGQGSLQRYYYNTQSRTCLPFTYRGRYGNQNNFLTIEACQSQCVSINVCPYGEPENGPDNRPLTCTFNGTECAPSHFCHLGLTSSENQCCPGEPTNPAACQGLPSQVGVAGPPGFEPVTRWYYDAASMTCLQFTFDGRKGNQNNFYTQADCEATCPVVINPCQQQITLPPTYCSVDSNTCSANSWCHIGAIAQTTLCCPYEGNPCELPLAVGVGTAQLSRWYYNSASSSCESFTYFGLKGNENSYLSQEACEQTCAPNPCAEGRPFIGVNGLVQTCSASASLNTCPGTYWCHVGADISTTVCCPGASQNSCNLPMSTGEGNAQLERYYYDSSSRTCKQFMYNGLKGNQNNFLTLRTCQLSCQPLDNPCIGQYATTPSGQALFCSASNKDTCPVNFWCHLGATPETTVCCPGPTNPCSVPLAPGTGNAGLARWYYNPDDRQCVPFQYNGRRGNQNNFLSQAECERTCPVFKNPCLGEVELLNGTKPRECVPMAQNVCSKGYFCLAGDTNVLNSNYCCKEISQDQCETYLSEGTGDLNLQRWYYNPITSKCQSFLYRGQQGNENNFLTRANCEETCLPLTNVCFGGEQPFKFGDKTSRCRSNADCPQTYYCHIGADKRSNVCCKRRGNPCDQQLMIGVGYAELPRYYYSEVDDRCIVFNYSGLAGNENNFATLSACEIACPGYRDYCPHGKPLLKSRDVVTCGIDTACPSGHVCHVAKKEGRSVCCPDPATFCLQPKYPGPCRGAVKRYFYNRSTGVCEKFLFGGCSGNLNNFESLESCTEICCDKEQLCLLSIDRGACSGRQTRYAFNRQTNSCVPFEYTGCGGNLNNFQSMTDCMSTCGDIGF